METWASWASFGLPGPTSVGFHVSSSNGSNMPSNTKDNMEGPNGGAGFSFADLEVIKTASQASANYGNSFSYTITVENLGDSDATNVSLNDDLPALAVYDSHVASQGTYTVSTGIWDIGTIVVGETKTLTITCIAGFVTTATTITNTADELTLDEADPVSANDTYSVDIDILPSPTFLSVSKINFTISDPVNGAINPKAIPGAIKEYTISTTNTGWGVVDLDLTIINDQIPANTSLYVDDINGVGSGPVIFIDGAVSSNLSYSFIALNSVMDDVSFSCDGGFTFTCFPTPDANGVDSSVTDIRINPKGTFAASDGTNHPSITVKFRVRVE